MLKAISNGYAISYVLCRDMVGMMLKIACTLYMENWQDEVKIYVAVRRLKLHSDDAF